MTRRRTIHTALAAAAATASLTLIGSAGAVAKSSSGPTKTQIAAAIRAAEKSPQLWATINICNSKGHRDEIGVRGQMPSLGFPSRLVMVFQLLYWSANKHTYLPVAKSRHPYVVGESSTATIQYGVSYSFSPKVTLIGEITFKWFRGPFLLGEVARKTTAGHKDVSDAAPPHYSVAICSI